MKQLIWEISLLLSLALLIIILLIIYRNPQKRNNKISIALILLILIEAFIGIHLLFCYQIGFPASTSQNNNTDLRLTSSDWLSFLSGYLSFAGSLVMAYLVYRQSKIIDEITLSEYNASASILIHACSKSTEYENFLGNNLIQYIPENTYDQYYTHHCQHSKFSGVQYENFGILIFAEIINNSKSTINKLSFVSIELHEVKENGRLFRYINSAGKWDPADKLTQLFPKRSLKRCFYFESIPSTLDISWMTIRFSYDGNQILETKVLVSKSIGEALTFLSVSEPCK